MELEGESYFRCSACGATDKATAIDYDRLGYPVCPSCGTTTGPLSGA
ncbi:hypothetical protein [Halegenticoccus soli]|nr:hypothetical protein [Halegenticoccus soli]